MKKAKLIVTILSGVSLMITAIILIIMGYKTFSGVDLVVTGTGSTTAAATADAMEKMMDQIIPLTIAITSIICGIALLVFGILLVTGLINKTTNQVKNKKVIKIIAMVIVGTCLLDILSASSLMSTELVLKAPALIFLIISLGLLIASLAIKVPPVYVHVAEPQSENNENIGTDN